MTSSLPEDARLGGKHIVEKPMNAVERIQRELARLPSEKQEEVADFVHFLSLRYGKQQPVGIDLLAHAGRLKDSLHLNGDPVEIQRNLRDEW